MPDEHGRADRVRPEAAGDPVHRLLGVPPGSGLLAQRELGGRPGHRDEARGAHPDQPQPRARVQARRRVQVAGGGIDLAGHIGGLGQGARAGDGGEVGEPQLHHDGPGHGATRPQAAGRPPGQPEQLPADHLGVVDIGGEGLLRPDALVRHTGDHRALVAAPGERVKVRAGRLAELSLQRRQRCVRDVGHGPQAEPGQGVPGLLPHAPQGGHRQRVQEAEHLIGRDDEQPVRLAPGGRELGHELAVGHPHRAGEALLLEDAGPDQLGDPGGAAQPPDGAGDIEERLVERQRLHLGGHRPEDRHDLGGRGGVDAAAGRDEDRLRAQPARPCHRHRRADPEDAGLVGRGEHHAAAAGTDDHRQPGELGPVTDLDTGVEGVHVGVEDVTAGIAASHRGYRYPTMWNWVAMSWKAGWAEAACSSASSASAAPGSASANMPGTRSAKTLTPWARPARRPAPSIRPTTAARVNRRGPPGLVPAAPVAGGPGGWPDPPPISASSRRASSNRPASARWITAATELAASTLTAPAGRSTWAIDAKASAGESTYSSTLWQSTRSALASPATTARSATSPWTTLSGTFISAARRSAAASESGLGSITVTLWPRPASGTANPPVPPPASRMSSRARPSSATSAEITVWRMSRTITVRASSYRLQGRPGGAATAPAADPGGAPPARRSPATANLPVPTLAHQCSAGRRQSPDVSAGGAAAGW